MSSLIVRSFQVRHSVPWSRFTIVMQSSTGQTNAHKLQPTQFFSMMFGILMARSSDKDIADMLKDNIKMAANLLN